jgi:hypothetical protein
MESKEINKSESTLTQGTMSRTTFPSFRIFLLSFSFPRDLLHEVFRCTFCAYLFFVFVVWISLLSNFFFSLVCFDFSLMLTIFCFWKYTYLNFGTIRTKKTENSFTEMTAKKLYKHQLYTSEIYICVDKKLLFERSELISIFD